MPNAPTHDFITVASAAVMTPFALNSGMPELDVPNTAVLVGSFLFSGLWLSPDLDTGSRPYRRWGPLRSLWLPYRKMVPHRSWVSHSILFGPLLRILYFACMLGLVAALGVLAANFFITVDPRGEIGRLARDGLAWVIANPWPVGTSLVGLVLGGAAHTIVDVVFSRVKRVF